MRREQTPVWRSQLLPETRRNLVISLKEMIEAKRKPALFKGALRENIDFPASIKSADECNGLLIVFHSAAYLQNLSIYAPLVWKATC